MLVSPLLILIIIVLPLASYNKATSTPIVGYQSTSYLSPKHVIEIYLIPQIISSFKVQDFTISVPQTLFDRLEITGLTGYDIYLNCTYIYQQASYEGTDELSITFSFNYKYLKYGIFPQSGTGSFACKTKFWHFIDKFNVINSNVHHILTMQTQWNDLDSFLITGHQDKIDIIKSMVSSQMEVRVAMAIEHQVNQVIGAYVNQVEKNKIRNILINDIAGIDEEMVVDMGIVNILTNSQGIYGYYNGTISYKDQSVSLQNIQSSDNIYKFEGVQMIGDVGTIWMQDQFELIATAVRKFSSFGFLTVDNDLVVKQLGIQQFDMTVGSWKSVIQGIQKRFDETQLVDIKCGFNSDQAQNFVKITQENGIKTDIEYSCKILVQDNQVLDMTLRVISSAIPSLTQNTDILILTPKSHDVSILTVKKIDSSDVFNQDQMLKRVDQLSSVVIHNADVNAQYYGSGVAVISDEYIEQVTDAQIEVNDGYLQVNWLARGQKMIIDQ